MLELRPPETPTYGALLASRPHWLSYALIRELINGNSETPPEVRQAMRRRSWITLVLLAPPQ